MNENASDAVRIESHIEVFGLRSKSVVVRVCHFCLYQHIKHTNAHSDIQCRRKVSTTRKKERNFTPDQAVGMKEKRHH